MVSISESGRDVGASAEPVTWLWLKIDYNFAAPRFVTRIFTRKSSATIQIVKEQTERTFSEERIEFISFVRNLLRIILNSDFERDQLRVSYHPKGYVLR